MYSVKEEGGDEVAQGVLEFWLVCLVVEQIRIMIVKDVVVVDDGALAVGNVLEGTVHEVEKSMVFDFEI